MIVLDADCSVVSLEMDEFDGMTISLRIPQGHFREADLILLYPEPRGTPPTLSVKLAALRDKGGE